MALEKIRQFLRETWSTFNKLEVTQKAAVVSMGAFLVCSVVASTALTFVLLGAGVAGFWLATVVISQTEFFSSGFLFKCLPTLIDPLKPGGKRVQQKLNYKPTTTSTTTDDQPTKSKSKAIHETDRNQQLSVNYNIQKLIEYILKDFVFSWYNTISDDDNVSDEIEHHLYQLSKNALPRLSKISPVQLLCIILELFRLHVHRYTRARTSLRRIARRGKKVDSSSLVASYETFALLHPAVQSESTELDYLRKCMDILQRVLLPPEIVQCKATHVLLNEILSVNVMQSLVDLISDPDTVNEIIILILDNDDVILSSGCPQSSTPRTIDASNPPEISQKMNREKGKSETKITEGLADLPPSYSAAIACSGMETYVRQSKVQLDHEIAKQSCESQSDNRSGKLSEVTDRLSNHQAADLDKASYQEMQDMDRQNAKDKGHGLPNIDTVLEKLTGANASKVQNDKGPVQPGEIAKYAKPCEQSNNSTDSRLSTSAIKLVGDSCESDKLSFQKSKTDVEQAVEVDHKPPELERKRSGVRMSYLQKLGIRGTKQSSSQPSEDAIRTDSHPKGLQPSVGRGEPTIPKHPEKKLSNLSPKLAPEDCSPQHSPKKEDHSSPQYPTSKSGFTFPIPFTALGPSLPLLKPAAQIKGQVIKQEVENNSSANATRDDSNLKFVPLTAIGPSILINPKGKDAQIDNESSSDGQLSRSSSSSSFASVTYEEDQQNIPFEEIDLQFAYGADRVAEQQTKESDKVERNGQSSKKSVNTLEPKSKVVAAKPFSLSDKSSEKSVKTKDEMLPVSQQSAKVTKGTELESEKQESCTKLKLKRNSLKVEATPEEQGLLAAISAVPRHVDSPPLSADPYSKEKEMTFQPIEPALSVPDSPTEGNKQPSLTNSPTKVGKRPSLPDSPTKRPSLTRSRTTPALLDVQGMAKQEVARSEVRLLEAKVGRFHISSVNIPSIELTKDRSGKEYVLYCIEYDVIAQGIRSNPSSNTAPGALPTGLVRKTVKRRHREFVNLHCRLDENSRLRRLLQDVKDPPKRLSVGLAFSAISKSAYEYRKIALEKYLKQLINQPLLGRSEEIAEFLALGGDAHIEFVKKRTDIAPKIDQFLQWAVPRLKTAVPRAVVDLGMGPTTLALSPPVSPKSQRRRKSRDASALTGREGAMSPSPLENLDMEWVHDNFEVESSESTRLQTAAHIFLQDHKEKDVKPSPDKLQTTHLNKPLNLGPRFQGDGCDASELAGDKVTSPQVLPMEEIELLDKIMALLTEAIHVQGQPSWILDERLQKGVCVTVGKPLDRWIKNQIESLLSEQWCAYYLTLIQDALWPNGELIQGSVVHTEEEKQNMKKDALLCLVNILPGYLSKIIGQDKWRTGMEVMLDSLQDPQLNRHLVFTLLDLLLEALAGDEVTDNEFQDALLSPS